MQEIVTVLGPVAPDELGFCQSHEHLCIRKGQSARINPDLCIDDIGLSLAELHRYRQASGNVVVDAQPVGCGRDAGFLEHISRESGVAVIASTGFHKMQFYPDGHWIFAYDQAGLEQLFIDELNTGMYIHCDDAPPTEQTSCRAGQIKTALDTGEWTSQYEKLFRAAAVAACKTGAAIMTHIEAGSDPVVLADYLEGEGVDLHRVIFCHMDRSVADIGIHKALCARGVTMEYDTVARPKYHNDNREVEIVKEMLAAGWEDQLLMSLDVTRARMLSYGGGVGLAYIRKTFLPLLSESGVSPRQLTKIFIENPARCFAKPL